MENPKGAKRPQKSKAGRPTLATAVALRENLLVAALDLFLAEGYGGASLHSIAKRAGVSRDTVYRQFADKKELFLAATGHAFSTMARHLEDVIRRVDPPQLVLEKVIRYIYMDTRDDRSNSVIRLAIMEAYRCPELRPVMLEESFRFLEPLTDYLQWHAERGLVRVGNAAETALLIANAAAGGASFFVQQRPENPEKDEERMSQILDFVLFGLQGSPENF